MYEVVALMPMRHNSSRVPGKNYRNFGDERPLFAHMASKLLNCRQICKVVIDTDSPTIIEFCNQHFPEIIIVNRPEELKDEHCPMNDILLHDVNQIPSKFYIQTHSTNPLLKEETINNSLQIFKKEFPKFDSLFSVSKINSRFWDATARPINHNPNILMRTQDLPAIYEENSCIYIFNADSIKNNHNRIGQRPYMLEIDRYEAIDIDEEYDFQIAEILYKQNQNSI